MCDTIAGELLVSFRDEDPAGHNLLGRIMDNEIEHVTIVDNLSERLARSGMKIKHTGFTVCRLRVPPGDESYKIGYLQAYYQHLVLRAVFDHKIDLGDDILNRTDYHLQVVPHSWLSIRGQQPGAGAGVGFNTSPDHNDYKKLCGLPAQPAAGAGAARKVIVVDTGLDPASPSNVVGKYNFVDDAKANDVSDDNGHGTAVTEIIRDLCPSAEFIVFKVADSTGRASEFDTLAALGVDNDADIANISLAFGLDDTNCPHCGRESRASRSAVFENLISRLSGDYGPLIIAAAGNGSQTELSFPARFDNVLAIESINRSRQLSQFTNRANIDHVGQNHANVFVLPGGDKPAGVKAPTEYVGTSQSGHQYYGTSFAAAYASGLIAALWSDPAHNGDDRATLLDHLRNNADQTLPGYAAATHGNGLMRFQ